MIVLLDGDGAMQGTAATRAIPSRNDFLIGFLYQATPAAGRAWRTVVRWHGKITTLPRRGATLQPPGRRHPWIRQCQRHWKLTAPPCISTGMSPAAKTGQILAVALFAFVLGLYAVKFSGSGWDWGNVIGCVSAAALCALNLFVLIRAFWKPSA
jgi:hypothetical protein